MHKSVYQRFEAGPALLYDKRADYRPDNVRMHVDFAHYFGRSAAQPPKCIADDIEFKWTKGAIPAVCELGRYG